MSHPTKAVTPSNKDMHQTTKQDHYNQVEGPYPRDKLKNTRHTFQLVYETIYYRWSDNTLIVDNLIKPINFC